MTQTRTDRADTRTRLSAETFDLQLAALAALVKEVPVEVAAKWLRDMADQIEGELVRVEMDGHLH